MVGEAPPQNIADGQMETEKKIIIIAGPNGAGKTTFAREYLSFEAACPIFINADLIAAALAPFEPEAVALRAGRLMLKEIDRCTTDGRNFAFETTLSGQAYAARIPRWRQNGYYVKLVYVGLPDAELAVSRVAKRVREGGHNVPSEVIRRRFLKGRNNFDLLYKPLVDWWIEYDNSEESPVFIEEGRGT